MLWTSGRAEARGSPFSPKSSSKNSPSSYSLNCMTIASQVGFGPTGILVISKLCDPFQEATTMPWPPGDVVTWRGQIILRQDAIPEMQPIQCRAASNLSLWQND